jgi:hypothetical protein
MQPGTALGPHKFRCVTQDSWFHSSSRFRFALCPKTWSPAPTVLLVLVLAQSRFRPINWPTSFREGLTTRRCNLPTFIAVTAWLATPGLPATTSTPTVAAGQRRHIGIELRWTLRVSSWSQWLVDGNSPSTAGGPPFPLTLKVSATSPAHPLLRAQKNKAALSGKA